MMAPYWDPLGEYENHDTIYTLTVYLPPRPPPRWIPSLFTRPPLEVSRTHVIRPPQDKPNYDCFERRDLSDMKTKTIKIKSRLFKSPFRCEHVQGAGKNNNKVCAAGCYVLENGGEVQRGCCKREDCEGHVYMGAVKEDENGVQCFGKKGERMVCIERFGR